MISSFLAVSQQVFILFIIVLVGFICSKAKFFSSECIAGIVKFVLYVVTPCVIIESFHREFDSEMLKQLGIAVVFSFVAHGIAILIAHVVIRDKDEARKKVFQFGTVFSNCGYMALPLQNALLGSNGIFFGAAYIAVFNILVWTYGLCLMSGSKKDISLKKVFLNPGLIGVVLGLLFFLTPLKLPNLILSPVKSFAAMNTPLPMVIIGYYLAGIVSFSFIKDAKLMLSVLLRLVVVPLATFGVFYILGLKGEILVSLIIACSSPVGANTAMFATLCKRDSTSAGVLVAVSTLLSIVTMPLIVALAISFM